MSGHIPYLVITKRYITIKDEQREQGLCVIGPAPGRKATHFRSYMKVPYIEPIQARWKGHDNVTASGPALGEAGPEEEVDWFERQGGVGVLCCGR